MRNFATVSIIMLLLLALTAPAALAGDATSGKKIFKDKGKGKCIVCHKITDKKKVGPGLAGVSSRHTDGWLKKWLTDTKGTWAENDGETQEMKTRLKKEKKKKPGHRTKYKFTGEDIDDLIAYLKTL